MFRIILPNLCMTIKAKWDCIVVCICTAICMCPNMMNFHIITAKLVANATASPARNHCPRFYIF